MTQSNPENILWLNFEATGLMSDSRTVPLEGAAIITDGNLNELASFGPIALKATREELLDMGAAAWELHTITGLIARCVKSSTERSMFDLALRDFAAPYFPGKGSALPDGSEYPGIVIGGNSVKFDFDVIEKFFPEIRKLMDYRVIDISGVGELMRRWDCPPAAAPPATESAVVEEATTADQSAVTDIRAGVDELRYYKQYGFVDQGAVAEQPPAEPEPQPPVDEEPIAEQEVSS
jgi:oligoribonuclease